MQSRVKVEIDGLVQGIGFRPFVYNLAVQNGLTGFTYNDPGGVVLEIQGEPEQIACFLENLRVSAPPYTVINRIKQTELQTIREETGFEIRPSHGGGHILTMIPPDISTCPECLHEVFTPGERRFGYPFTNCSHCGPRFSIIRELPYDRPGTTMAGFKTCEACRKEYITPSDRRFHAQPIACPRCGPRLQAAVSENGRFKPLDSIDPLADTVKVLTAGGVAAIKGIGGFHLAADATSSAAIAIIRSLKTREAKPLALLCRDLNQVHAICWTDSTAEALLSSEARPIVILPRRKDPTIQIDDLVAPGQATLGVMLPYTPLHHLLMRSLAVPLVMTSANRGDEPIAISEEQLAPEIVDGIQILLTHNRPIQNRCDDSVVISAREPIMVRRSRGYVPYPVTVPEKRQTLGIGADFKNTACFLRNGQAYLTQHLGSLDDEVSIDAAREDVSRFQSLFRFEPEMVGCDMHPEYHSRRLAYQLGLPVVEIQHHHAHIAACMAENQLSGPTIGVAFDGTGYGTDGTIWGGEFLLTEYHQFTRMGSLAPVLMPGAEKAAREPWRMAVSYLYQSFDGKLPDFPGADQLYSHGVDLLVPLLREKINSPVTTSMGRLFDAVAAILGINHYTSYEGEAAIRLETASRQGRQTCPPYPYEIREADFWQIDYQEMIRQMIMDIRSHLSVPEIASRFHETLAATTVSLCQKIKKQTGINRVALSGGVFQNVRLLETARRQLEAAGMKVYIHRMVPSNDGGISLGQAVIASRTLDQ